ncbi:TPA: hypothetical protein EYO12_02885 [Candidatus Saccharibacteria bacterium]|nr:hypothetical protein [Candidatus Saccharibacteria bacterium]HIO88016.1 hypothetical protein [Candidatus Saccharibacteria bacterium]
MKEARFSSLEADTLYDTGIKHMEDVDRSLEEAITAANNMPAISAVLEAVSNSKHPSEKIVAFPTSEYTLIDGFFESTDERVERVKILKSISNPDDSITLTPGSCALNPYEYMVNGIESILQRGETAHQEETATRLVSVYGPRIDPSKLGNLHYRGEGDKDLKNIYLVFSGGYLVEPVKNTESPEMRKLRIAMLRAAEEERAQQQSVSETTLKLF